MARARTFCLTFDVEEFDLPDEVGVRIDPGQRREIERSGVERLLQLCGQLGPLTCFVTGAFALEYGDLVGRLAAAGCDIACHGLEHADRYPDFSRDELVTRLREARRILQDASGQEVSGHRGPRFTPAPEQALLEAGFCHDSSVHPTWVPGRYNHLGHTLTPTRSAGGLWQLPVTVMPRTRLPLSWIWLRNMPAPMLDLCLRRLVRDAPELICLYLHPWELCDLNRAAPGLPWPLRRNTGDTLAARLLHLAGVLQESGYTWDTLSRFMLEKGP